jgi:tellurite resistance protein
MSLNVRRNNMFLHELNKKESIVFINLVREFANIDEIFAKEEENLIEEYIKELELDGDEIYKLTLEEVEELLKESSERAKKIIYFELVGLALVDGEYEHKEKVFLNNLAYSFNIGLARRLEFMDFFRHVKSIYDFTVVDYDNKIELLKEHAEKILA